MQQELKMRMERCGIKVQQSDHALFFPPQDNSTSTRKQANAGKKEQNGGGVSTPWFLNPNKVNLKYSQISFPETKPNEQLCPKDLNETLDRLMSTTFDKADPFIGKGLSISKIYSQVYRFYCNYQRPLAYNGMNVNQFRTVCERVHLVGNAASEMAIELIFWKSYHNQVEYSSSVEDEQTNTPITQAINATISLQWFVFAINQVTKLFYPHLELDDICALELAARMHLAPYGRRKKVRENTSFFICEHSCALISHATKPIHILILCVTS